MAPMQKASLKNTPRQSLHLLLENIASLNRAVELQSVIKRSIQIIQKVMHAEAGSLMLLDQSTGELEVSVPTGPVKNEIRGKRLPSGSGIGGWVVENKEPYLTNDPENCEYFAGDLSDEFTTREIICVPVFGDGSRVLGVLQAINRQDDEGGFGDDDIPVFEALAEHVGIAIERSSELEELQQEVEKNEMMLTEVHHRIKNNLSTITALIEMETSEVEDEKSKLILQNTVSRIESMTDVHNLLYNSGFNNDIDLGVYLEKISQKIATTLANPSQNVGIDVRAESIKVDSERAMTCGLIMNELIVNCYKHAFKNSVQDGRITINITKSNNGYISLKVSDNGVGVGEEFQFKQGESVGSWLIDVLLRRLEAAIDITESDGTTFIIRFKI